MGKRLSKKQRFFNDINFTADDEVYIGIDIHKAACRIAARLNNGIAQTFVKPSNNTVPTRQRTPQQQSPAKKQATPKSAAAQAARSDEQQQANPVIPSQTEGPHAMQ